MKKKLVIRCVLGALIGVALMFLIPALINRAPIGAVIYSDALLARVGSPAATILTLAVMGVYGALCFGGTLFYEIEKWPLALATAAHYAVIALPYGPVSLLLCWKLPLRLFLVIEGIMAVGFILIWLLMYLLFKARVRELNELQKKYKNENTSKTEPKGEQA